MSYWVIQFDWVMNCIKEQSRTELVSKKKSFAARLCMQSPNLLSTGGGGFCLCEGCTGSDTLPPLIARPWRVQPGPADLLRWGRGLQAWGPVTSLTSTLWGQQEGARLGGSRAFLSVVRLWALSLPQPPVPGLCHWGPLIFFCGRGGCGSRGLSPLPQCTLLGGGAARFGGGERAPRGWGGGALCLREGCSGLGTLPPPTAGPWGVRPRLIACLPWARGCRHGGPSPSPGRTLLRAGVARRGGRRRAPGGGGGASCLREGCREWVTRPHPTSRPWGFRLQPGAPFFFCGSRGRTSGGTLPTPQCTLLRAGVARCGAGRTAPWWGRLVPPCGVFAVGHSPSPSGSSLGCAAGARCPLSLGAGGASMGARQRPHSPRSWELALRAVEEAGGRPGGGGARDSVRGVSSWALPV